MALEIWIVDSNGAATKGCTEWVPGKNNTGTTPGVLPNAIPIPLKRKYLVH